MVHEFDRWRYFNKMKIINILIKNEKKKTKFLKPRGFSTEGGGSTAQWQREMAISS